MADDVITGISKLDYTCWNEWKTKYGVDTYTSSGKTLLTLAIRRRQSMDTISFLLKNGADINRREKGGAKPLLIAIYLNQLHVVKYLLKNGVDNKASDSCNSPLTAAVKTGNLDMVQLLLDNAANATEPDLEGVPPFIRAIMNNKLEMVDIFLRCKKGVLVVDNNQNTPLIVAIMHNCKPEIIKRLLEHTDNVDKLIRGKALLGWAARLGNLEAVKLLLSTGADINLLDSGDNTALATAVQCYQYEIAEYLVENNANVCKAGENGKSPLLWAVLDEDLDMINLLLDHGAEYIIHKVFLEAVATQNLEVIQCLMNRKIPINSHPGTNTEITPLEKAIDIRSVEITKYFIENGASVVEDLHEKEINYILRLLIEGNIEMAKLLTESGARINEYGECGDTLLTASVKIGNFDMMRYFLTQGADVNLANREGLVGLAIAESNDDFKTFQYLVESGATISETEQESNSNVAMYYDMAKENILRRKQKQGTESSNQESA